ncbi:hypothetical protein RSP03_14300 [Cereibacter sphaeroides]|nr:hypothetical protein RSP03_14300 [Cereibacter sphaeroides]
MRRRDRFLHQKLRQCQKGPRRLALDRTGEDIERGGPAEGRGQHLQQPVAVQMQVEMGKAVVAGEMGPHRQPGRHIEHARQRPAQMRPAAGVVRQPDRGDLVEKDHDPRMLREIVAPSAPDAAGLPEDAGRALHPAPPHRRGAIDPVRLSDEVAVKAHPAPGSRSR